MKSIDFFIDIWSKKFTPDEIEKIVGVNPYSTHIIGELLPWNEGICEENYFCIYFKYKNYINFSKQLCEFMEHYKDTIEKIKPFVIEKEMHVVLSGYIWRATKDILDITITPDTLKILAETNFSFRFETYG